MSDYTNGAVVVGDPVLDGHGGISEFYAGVDYAGRPTGSLIAINRNGCFYLDAGGEWVERPELIFDIYGEYTREGEMIAETFGTFVWARLSRTRIGKGVEGPRQHLVLLRPPKR
ncbi:MAG TPA: hypothetical protein VGJ58_06685 [Gaiellaceae bacterium]|jgi:hypothetical protein